MKAKERPDPTDNGGTPDVASVRFLDRNRPAHTPDEVRDVASRIFGISGDCQELWSERDQGMLVGRIIGVRVKSFPEKVFTLTPIILTPIILTPIDGLQVTE